MGFLRKSLIIGTGGLAPIKARSYRERTAKATEELAKLQNEQLRLQRQQAAPKVEVPSEATRPSARSTGLWLIDYEYEGGGRVLAYGSGGPACYTTESTARERAAYANEVQTPLGSKSVVGYSLIRTDPQGEWQLLLELPDGTQRAVSRFSSEEDAMRAGKAWWKVSTKDQRVVLGWRVQRLDVQTPDAAAGVQKSEGSASATLEHLRQLGELHEAGILSDSEFESKRTELLRRI